MSTRVLLHKETCEIMEGHRVSLFDKVVDAVNNPSFSVRAMVYEHDGWILHHPRTGPFSYFMNRKFVEKDFIELGSLE